MCACRLESECKALTALHRAALDRGGWSRAARQAQPRYGDLWLEGFRRVVRPDRRDDLLEHLHARVHTFNPAGIRPRAHGCVRRRLCAACDRFLDHATGGAGSRDGQRTVWPAVYKIQHDAARKRARSGPFLEQPEGVRSRLRRAYNCRSEHAPDLERRYVVCLKSESTVAFLLGVAN